MHYTKIAKEVLVRHPANPILTARDFPIRIRAVYNSAAVKMPDGHYVMLCRVNQLNNTTLLWFADSTDGVHFKPRPEPIDMPEDELWKRVSRSVYYDPRITYLDGEYKVLVACEGDQACRVALFSSRDLETLQFVNYLNVPDNRNMVLFPDKSLDGRYMRLERPNLLSIGGRGDIWLSFSPDLIHWGDSYEVLRHDNLPNYAFHGLGTATVPYRTAEGWLFLFHAIMKNASSMEFSVGAALLDLDEPWSVLHVTKHPILQPTAEYELRGAVEHVCFPCSKIIEPDGSVKVYYGAADTVQCLAVGKLDDIIYACQHW